MNTREIYPTGFLALLIGFVFLAGGAFIALRPDEFEAVVRIRMNSGGNSYDPFSILGELQTIKSGEILNKVIASQNLAEKWGAKYNDGEKLSDAQAERMVRQELGFQVLSDTALLEIHVVDDDSMEAAALANSIAGAYRDLTIERFDKAFIKATDQREKEIQEWSKMKDAEVKVLQQKLEEQKRELNISDETTASNQPAAAPYFATKKELETARRLREIDKHCYEGQIYVPGELLVEIIDPAKVPTSPMFRNRPLDVALPTAGFALIGCGIVFLRKPQTEGANP